MMNPITAAVLPLKTEAIDRATKYAWTTIETVKKELIAVGMDAQKYAPYPNSSRLGVIEYRSALAKYELVHTITEHAWVTRSWHDPDIRKFSEEWENKFVEGARKDAAHQYDLFVEKLISKIGDCLTATLEGNHVWSFSILTVTKDTGVERWKTQMIINVSKYGKIFNQFPTRKVK